MGKDVAFKAYAPQQGDLLQAYVGEALDPSDPALFIDDLVESLDLRRFEKRYRRRGERAFPPEALAAAHTHLEAVSDRLAAGRPADRKS